MRRHRPTLAVALAAAATLSMAATACSSERRVGSASTSTATTTVGSTTAPATSVEPTVEPTVAPTEPPATTTPVPAGWTVIDPATVGAPLAYPCCASNWYGAPSPPLPAAGEPLADGVYRIVLDWPADLAAPIAATVHRFEQCAVLPAGSCEQSDAYQPDELGIDGSTGHPLTVTLDPSLRVVLGGFTGDDGGGFAVGNGADLAELLAALDADYQTAVLDRHAAGMTAAEIVAALVATPANGFGPPAVDSYGALVYTHADAPPLLFQYLPGVNDELPGSRGIDIVGRIALIVDGGRLTLTTFAGFYS